MLASFAAGSKIVQVANAAGLKLKRAGARLVGLCPFHNERGPSFSINPAMDAFHCLGCGVSGGYVQLAERMGVNLDDTLGKLEGGTGAVSRDTRPGPAPAPRLPRAEVVSLWSDGAPVTTDAAVTAWLRGRGIDAEHAQDRDLARALPTDVRLPQWASFKGASWTTAPKFRCILPMYNERGQLASLRARALAPGEVKELSPIGGGPSGLVLADELGRRMLAGEADAIARVRAARYGVLIAEGCPDFLTWATCWGDAAEDSPAILGVMAGSWKADAAIASRIPDGAHVFIATHHDQAGERYAADIVMSLKGRDVKLSRWKPKGE